MTEFFTGAWEWYQLNSGLVWEGVAGLFITAGAVTGMSKTPKDDEYLKRALRWVSPLAPKDAPGTLEWPFSKPRG